MMSAHWTCLLWTVLGAGLLGWGIKGVVLGTLMDDKRREMERLTNKIAALTKLANQPPEVRTVEKRVEVPVERVVVKHVEVPVEKVVDRPVDNPEHLARINALEGEVAVIAGLFTQIAQLKTLSFQTGEAYGGASGGPGRQSRSAGADQGLGRGGGCDCRASCADRRAPSCVFTSRGEGC